MLHLLIKTARKIFKFLFDLLRIWLESRLRVLLVRHVMIILHFFHVISFAIRNYDLIETCSRSLHENVVFSH